MTWVFAAYGLSACIYLSICRPPTAHTVTCTFTPAHTHTHTFQLFALVTSACHAQLCAANNGPHSKHNTQLYMPALLQSVNLMQTAQTMWSSAPQIVLDALKTVTFESLTSRMPNGEGLRVGSRIRAVGAKAAAVVGWCFSTLLRMCCNDLPAALEQPHVHWMQLQTRTRRTTQRAAVQHPGPGHASNVHTPAVG